VNLIGSTTTETGLTINADLDNNSYPIGIEVSDQEMATINITKHKFHGDWNYTIAPNR
jgi:hypothetical protein